MQLPDEEPPFTLFVQEELIESFSEKFGQLLEFLPPVTRLRLLAFMHLAEQPSTMRATLEVQPSGVLRLTLDTAVAPYQTQQH